MLRIVLFRVFMASALFVSGAFGDGGGAQEPVTRLAIPMVAADPSRALEPAPLIAAEVAITGSDFVPSVVTVAAGEAVRWRHLDGGLAHNVAGGDFSSPVGTEGMVFVHTFAVPGAYPYTCFIHPFMQGEVVVTGGG